MTHYYIENQGKVVGPLSLNGIKDKKLNADTLVWRHGFDSWTPAEQVEELKSWFSAGPPPLPVRSKQLIEIPTKKEPVKKKSSDAPVYDERYRKETEVTTTGIFLMLTPLLFIIFYKRAFYHSEYFSYLKIISLAGAAVIRVIATTWVMRVARHQNRDINKWAITALFLPALSMIVIGLSKKLYDADEWKKHLYNEKRQKSNAYFHAAISERY